MYIQSCVYASDSPFFFFIDIYGCTCQSRFESFHDNKGNICHIDKVNTVTNIADYHLYMKEFWVSGV